MRHGIHTLTARIFPVHPLIRIISFIVFVLSLSHAVWWDLCVAGLGLGGLYLYLGITQWQPLARLIWRLRWFFLTIVIFYVWFLPGDVTVAPGSVLGWPNWVAVEQGMLRIVVLLLVITALYLLQTCTDRDSLLSGIYGLLLPFKCMVSPQRVAMRIMLTMSAVEQLQAGGLLRLDLRKDRRSPKLCIQAAVVRIFTDIMHQAASEPCRIVHLPAYHAPAAIQWLMPLVLAVLFVVL